MGTRREFGIGGILLVTLAGLVILHLIGRATGGGSLRVPVVGAGAISGLTGAHAPEGVRYALSTVAEEPWAETHARVNTALGQWPDVIVVGLDVQPDAAGIDARRACEAARDLVERVGNATAIPVLLTFSGATRRPDDLREALRAANACVLDTVCTEPRRVCVEVDAVDSLPAAVAAAVLDAEALHTAWRATTQVGR